MRQEFLQADDPERVGSYALASRLGAGGQGVVYEAYDASGTRCVVKVLHREGTDDPFARDRFRKEVVASQRVDSFCTARILAAAPEAQPPYIVSEFVDGRDLQAAVAEGGPLDGDQLVRLATGVATALTAIHARFVVHRDLKPGNVLLGPDGPRVIDFGIARTHEMSLTETGKMMGTPGYMAPEVLRGARADGKSDVFAWGAVVLFAATGRAPFRGENLGEIVVRVTEEEPDLAPLPERIRPLVDAALSKDPTQRPTSAELLFRLLTEGRPASQPVSSRELLARGARAAARSGSPGHVPAALPEWGSVAEQAYAAMDSMTQAVAQEVLLRLVVPGEEADGSQDGVRTAEHGELVYGRPAHEVAVVEQVLTVFAGERVLSREPDGSVRLVGAALHRAWPRLAAWTTEHRETLRRLRRLGDAARAWERAGRDAGYLLRGSILRAASEDAGTASAALRPNLVEREFLKASRLHESRRHRQRRRLRVGVGVLLVMALVAGVAAWQIQRTNTEQQKLATARDVAAVANGLRESDPGTAALLSIAAWRVAPAKEARAALYRSAWQHETAVFQAPTKGTMTQSPTYTLSSDGRTVVTETPDGGKVRRFDTRTGKELTPYEPGEVGLDTLSPDGKFGVDNGVVRKLGTGEAVGKVPDEGVNVETLTSGGGRALDVVEDVGSAVVDTRTGRTLLEVADTNTRLSENGRYVVSCPAKKRPVIHDVTTGSATKLRGAEPDEVCDEGFDVSFSGDGSLLVLSSAGGTLSVWDTSSGRLASQLHMDALALNRPSPDDSSAPPVRMSQDGEYVAVMAEEAVAVMKAVEGAPEPLITHPTDARFPAMTTENPLGIDSERGELTYVDGSSVHTLDLHSLGLSRKVEGRLSGRFGPEATSLLTVEVGEQGRRIRTWGVPETVTSDGESRLKKQADIPVVQGSPLGEPVEPTEYAAPAELSPDGRMLAYPTGDEKTSPAVVLQNTRTGKTQRTVELGGQRGGPVAALAFSQDGSTLAVSRAPTDGRAGWSVDIVDITKNGKTRTLPGVGDRHIALTGSGENMALVTTSGDRVDLSTGKVKHHALGGNNLRDVVASPDGKTLAVSESAGITLWNGDATSRVGYLPGPVEGWEGNQVSNIRFSPDGDSLVGVVGENDAQVHLWDVPSRKPMGGVLPGIDDSLQDVAFDERGNLHLAGSTVSAFTMNLDPERLIGKICRRTDRAPLTHDEWMRNVPGAPYQKVCD